MITLKNGEKISSLPRNAETAALVIAICGTAYLRYYAHALPCLTSIGGTAYLQGYAHALPELTSIGASADLEGCAHALPKLTSIGDYADLRGYAHALPGLTSIGGSADLRGYAHADWDWLIAGGSDRRDYYFSAMLEKGVWRIKAGCRNFTVQEAISHWKNRGNPECLKIVQRLASKIQKRTIRETAAA